MNDPISIEGRFIADDQKWMDWGIFLFYEDTIHPPVDTLLQYNFILRLMVVILHIFISLFWMG